MKIYRHNSKKYNDLLFNIGILRIGTLYDFRKSEHKKGISDPKEGTKTVTHKGSVHIDSTDNIDDYQKNILKGFEELNAIKIEGNCKNITINNCNALKQVDSANYFILCTASKSNLEGEFEGYNSCYEILERDSFFTEITYRLNKILPVRFLGYFSVIYRDREEKWEENGNKLHPSLIKELEYKGQYEIRAIWEPLNKNIEIEPIILGSYKLGKYMKKVF